MSEQPRSEPSGSPGEHRWTGRATTWIAAGSAVNGLGAFLFQIVGTRVLGADGYAPVGVLWTLQYLWVAVAVTALEAYVTRLVIVRGHDAARVRRFLRLLRRWLLAAAAVAGVAGVVAAGPLFSGNATLGVSLGLLVLAYGWYGVVRGRAAGMDRFRAYALATAAESSVRLVAAVVVLAAVASTPALGWVFPLGPLAVAAFAWVRSHPAARIGGSVAGVGGGSGLPAGPGGGSEADAGSGADGGRAASAEARDVGGTPSAPEADTGQAASAEAPTGSTGEGEQSGTAAGDRAGSGAADSPVELPVAGPVEPPLGDIGIGEDGKRREATRFLAATSTANAAVQFLLAGGPLMLVLLRAGPAAISVLFTTVTLARVPMTFALNGGLSRLLPPLTRMAQADDAAGIRRAAVWIVAAIGGVAGVSAGGAALIGPEVVELLFGPEFRPERAMIVVVATGTVLAVGGLLLDQLYIATGRQARLPVVWVAAVVVAVALVAWLPGTATMRVASGFALATAGGVVALMIGLLGPAARRPSVG